MIVAALLVLNVPLGETLVLADGEALALAEGEWDAVAELVAVGDALALRVTDGVVDGDCNTDGELNTLGVGAMLKVGDGEAETLTVTVAVTVAVALGDALDVAVGDAATVPAHWPTRWTRQTLTRRPCPLR